MHKINLPFISLKIGPQGWAGDFLVALSAANLALLSVWAEFFYLPARSAYYLPVLALHDYGAALLLFVSLSILFLLVLRWHRCYGLWGWLTGVMTLFVFMLPLLILIRNSLQFSTILTIGVLMVIPITLTAFFFARQLGNIVYVILFIMFPFSLLNLFYTAADSLSTQTASEARPDPAFGDGVDGPPNSYEASSDNRIVFIIFDELDAKRMFSRKEPHYAMPNFAELKNQSWFFKNMESLSVATRVAIPIITSGHLIKSAVAVDAVTLRLKLRPNMPNSDRQLFWRAEDTFLKTAQQNNMSMAIIAYYHPYCRIFSAYGDCRDHYMNAVMHQATDNFQQSLLMQLKTFVPIYRRLGALENHYSAFQMTLAAVSDPQKDFIYAHFMPPHLPNLYDARSQSMTVFNFSLEKYFDNLVLVDRMLGQIVKAMKKENLWEKTTLLVTSDHGWRESQLYDGQPYSPSVPLFIKLANQQDGVEYDGRWTSADIKPLMDFLIDSSSSPGHEQLADYLRKHPSKVPERLRKQHH